MNFDTSILSARILSEFNVGESHTNVYIKGKLKDIYSEIGYKVNAKATDLGNYFDTKKCLIQEGSKRVNGLKLISKKV